MTTRTHADSKLRALLLVCCLAGGVLATGVTQAAGPADADTAYHPRNVVGETLRRVAPGLELARKLKDWRPRVTWQDATEGFNLLRPFGKNGPTIQCSSSLPASVRGSLRAGGDARLSADGIDTDLFVFLQKRW